MSQTFCNIDGKLLDDCPHIGCENCGEVRQVCGGCFKCPAHHDPYGECEEWPIAVEVVGVVFEVEEGEKSQ